MTTQGLDFRSTNYFSSFICDYLEEKDQIKQLYNRYPKLSNFELQIQDKKKSFKKTSRHILTKTLNQQYKKVSPSNATQKNIDLLNDDNTFTITTGHQLNLFTGPLYFLYKIFSTINLSEQLKQEYPNYNFVPIYWMASEDHDFEEINYFNFKEKKIKWPSEQTGAVGTFKTENLASVFEAFATQLGKGHNANYLKQLFTQGYLNHTNLADATRYIANELFKSYGLVILDANTAALKQLFIPFATEDLINNAPFKDIEKTNQLLQNLGYKTQVNPRKINLFYLKGQVRERIIFENNTFKVNNTSISWNKESILKELNEFPERFSPNVVLRPLYQEVILPNLCYIGGGGELAYWLQFKSFFNKLKVPFPMLLLRNSVLIKSSKQALKQNKLKISTPDLFLKQNTLITKQVKHVSKITIDLASYKHALQNQFKDMYELAKHTDASFLGAVAAQEKKQLKGITHLEKRLLKAQKRKLKSHLLQVETLQNQLFPNYSLQERQLNFSELYLEHGKTLLDCLKQHLKPLSQQFLVLEI